MARNPGSRALPCKHMDAITECAMSQYHAEENVVQTCPQEQGAVTDALPLIRLMRHEAAWAFPTSQRYRSAVRAALRLAAKVEPDPLMLIDWCQTVPIEELDDLTALELISQGRATAVTQFLSSILGGKRG